MKTQKITEGEISSLKVANLPTRPTAPREFGGRGYTATELKAAFDALPLYIIDKFNSLIEDIGGEPSESVASVIRTGILEGHTLADLFSDIVGGELASYLVVLDEPLCDTLVSMKEEIAEIKAILSKKGLI